FGPSLCIGLCFFRIVNIPAFFIANIIIDIEPFSVLFFKLNYPLHGFFHSFLGGTILSLIISGVIYYYRKEINKFMSIFYLSQNISFRSIFLGAITGAYLHIFLDAFLYTDIKPFYPFRVNPLYGMVSLSNIYLFCVITGIVFVICYLVRLVMLKTRIK
ncbi:MAG: metal-dependent hydrolase, partial [Candidatus Omnitrophota bacterium]